MTSLLPINATPQEVALDLTTARIADVEVPTRSIWSPQDCPADLLPWLAWAFSVDRWDSDWSVEQKRGIVAAAVRVHRRKGTPAAVKEVVDLIFGGAEVVEAWNADDLQPHEFKIVATGLFENEAAYDELIRLVDAAKPVRSWLKSIQVRRSGRLPLYYATVTRAATTARMLGRLPSGASLAQFFGGATRYASTMQINHG